MTGIQSSELTLKQIWEGLVESGHDPVRQLTNYLMSGDPTYLPARARPLATGVYRDDLIEVLVSSYFAR